MIYTIVMTMCTITMHGPEVHNVTFKDCKDRSIGMPVSGSRSLQTDALCGQTARKVMAAVNDKAHKWHSELKKFPQTYPEPVMRRVQCRISSQS